MRALRLGLLLHIFLLFSPVILTAQEGPATGGDVATEPEASAPPREQTIYVPYDKLRNTFEKEGRGVFIPYERFQELWRAAREHQRKPFDVKPPTPAVITEADNEATVAKEVVQVKARLKIDLLGTGWIEVPLRLQGAGVISATMIADGKEESARLAVADDGGYKLVVENKTKNTRQIELRLEYAQEFKKTPGRNEISFAAPQAPVNRWRVRVPETGVKVNIEPLIAATEPPAAGADEKVKETVLLAFVGAASSVKIDWTAKAEGASGLAALANVEANQEVRIEEGAVRTLVRLQYSISRADLSQLLIEVPNDQKVVNVSDANVRQWSVEAGEKTQKITVQLFEPARSNASLQIELEQFSDQKKAEAGAIDAEEGASRRTIEVPVVKALDASRQQGAIVVNTAEGLQIEASKREGLSQVDANDLPAELRKQAPSLAYRYSALPFALTLEAIKIKPRVSAEELVAAFLQPDQLTLNLHVVYTIERAGIFDLKLDVPAGFEVRDVRGDTIGGAEAAQVDTHRFEGADKTRLVVDLSRKALGRVALFVQLRKELNDPNLLGPTGKTSEIALPIPRVAPESIERTMGRLVMYAPESLRVNPTKQAGLRSVSLAEALAGAAVSPPAESAAARPVSSFVYTKGPVDLSIAVDRRKPFLTVGQLLMTRVDPGVVKYEATMNYEIRYSSVKSLRLDVPAEIAPQIHNNTPGITEKVIDPPPADLAQGYIAWSLTGESELLGPVVIKLSWERRLESLEVGKNIDLISPRLIPRDVDRAWGQVVLAKAETIDLVASGTPTGLRPIDPQHDLMPGTSIPDAALAFEFHEDWSLNVTATRYQLESVKHTSIERGLVRAVFTRGGQLAVQALYRMRSARQRLMVELPEGVEFDTEPLRINGQSTPLERGAKGEFFVPLVGRGNNEAFLLELRYTLPDSKLRVELPSFPDEPAVQQVFISAFVPDELTLLGSQGPWTDEQAENSPSPRPWPASRYSDPDLIRWVSEGVSLSGSPADTFPVDGQALIYSTLRPEAGEAGSLKLSTLNGKWLHAFIFAGVLGLGIALVRRPLADRATAIGIAIVILLLLGVFLPTFSTQILYGGFWLAIVLTAIIWCVAAVRSRVKRHRESPPSSSPPAPPPETPTAPAAEPSEGGESHA
jgi:hypothetical protein